MWGAWVPSKITEQYALLDRLIIRTLVIGKTLESINRALQIKNWALAQTKERKLVKNSWKTYIQWKLTSKISPYEWIARIGNETIKDAKILQEYLDTIKTHRKLINTWESLGIVTIRR